MWDVKIQNYHFFRQPQSDWHRDICNEPRVRTRFWCHNPVVLCCTIIVRAIGEQPVYAIKILFGLVARHKCMLCRSLLGGFRSYPFLWTCVGLWYLETRGSYDASLLNVFFFTVEWLMRAVVGCTVVERKVKLTWGNGWTRLNNLSTVHSPFQPIGVWNAHAADAKMPFMRTSRGVTLHLCKFNFMAGYEVWAHYGESVRQRTASVT
jgi:hypothetical protein